MKLIFKLETFVIFFLTFLFSKHIYKKLIINKLCKSYCTYLYQDTTLQANHNYITYY